jgi:hypothetical protein
MSRRGLDSTSKLDGYELDSRRGIRKAMLSRSRRPATWLAGSFTAAVVVLACVGVAASQAEPMPNGVPGTWQLKLNEEFSSSGLNTSLWTPGWQHGGISAESERCLSSALVNQPGDGYLHLWLHKETNTCEGTHSEYTGSLVESNPNDGVSGHTGFQYSYGYVEWRAYVVGTEEKCSLGGCIPDWPALWSLPGNHETEIDTMEGLNGEACYHFHPPFPGGTGGCAGNRPGWNTYGVNWEPGLVTFYYDGTQVGQVTSSKINSTPQYVVMDMTAPCSCGGKLVVPDELDIDYVRVWQHPAPTVTSEPASEVRETSAVLHGSVNPNNVEAHYYFQYGTTTSYGSTTPEGNAGAGGSSVSESASITGLEPGTTYHYRIVASSSDGTSYGADQSFRTSAKPSVTTEAATGVSENAVTSHGSVNPEGLSTKYYFQYGTSTNYGSSTPEHSAGSGTSSENVTATVTGLEPNAVYHFRLVANNSDGTSYGADEKLTTLPIETSSNWVIRDPDSGDTWVYYVNTSGQVAEWNWDGSSWQSGVIGGSVASGTTPTVVRDPVSGDVWIYYVNSSHQIAQWDWDGSSWQSGLIGGSVASGASPAVVRNPTSGDTWVYYVNSSGQIAEWNWDGASWQGGVIGGSVASGTSPAVVRDPSSGDLWVYYINSSAKLAEWNWDGASWQGGVIGGSVASGTSPAVVRSPSSGDIWVYYVNSSAAVAEWNWDGASWQGGVVGGTVKTGTSLSVTKYPGSSDIWVYYVNGASELAEWNWDTVSWQGGTIGGSIKSGTSPAVAPRNSLGDTWVYYVNSSSQIAEWNWDGVAWQGGTL